MVAREYWEKTIDLGRGTFGVVWQERCQSGHPHESPKLRPLKQTPKKYEVLWRKERDALVKFAEHRDHFVQYFESFADDRHLYIAMEYIPHGSLQSYIRKRPLPETEAAVVIAQLAQGLQHMHRANFIHRDLKPDNILVSKPGPEWRVKISDFGTAKDTAAFHSTRGEVGTQGYMAPEIYLLSEGRWTAAVDVWSLGSVAHCLLTMRPPFNAVGELIAFAQQGTPLPVKAVGRASYSSVDFIQKTMTASMEDRLRIDEVIQHEWLGALPQHSTSHTLGFGAEPSNAWANTFASDVTYKPMPARPAYMSSRSPRTSISAPGYNGRSSAPSNGILQAPSPTLENSSSSTFDWSSFFTECGVSQRNSKTYTDIFEAEEMSPEILSDVDAQVLRNLGLKQGDVLRVMRAIGRQQSSLPFTSNSLLSDPGLYGHQPGHGSIPSRSGQQESLSNSGSDISRRSSPHAYDRTVPAPALISDVLIPGVQSNRPSSRDVIPNAIPASTSDASKSPQSGGYPYLPKEIQDSTPASAHIRDYEGMDQATRQSRTHPEPEDDSRCFSHLSRSTDTFSDRSTDSSPHTIEHVDGNTQPSSAKATAEQVSTRCLTCGQDYLSATKLQNHQYWTGHDPTYKPSETSIAPTPYAVVNGDEALRDLNLRNKEEHVSTRCLVCGHDYLSAKKLRDHTNRTGHQQEDSQEADRIDPALTCLAPERSFNTRDDLFEHLEANPRHARDKWTGRSEILQRDSAYATATSEPVPLYNKSELTCLGCERSFVSREDLFHHLDNNPKHARDRTTGRKEKYVSGRYY